MKKITREPTAKDFAAWSDRVERHFKSWIIILAVLLALSQLLLQFPSVRHNLTTTDQSEGVPYYRQHPHR